LLDEASTNPSLADLLATGRYEGVILDSIADGVFAVDLGWRIRSFNRAAEEITGIPSEQALGEMCCEVFRASVCETACVLRETMESGRQITNRPVYIVRSDGRRIPVTVSTALLRDDSGATVGGVETFRDLSVEEELRRELGKHYTFEDMVSKNADLLALFDILPDIAASDSTVLIQGESGTGKELVARAIHNISHRAAGPLVVVNCAALPDTLLESELFGHKAGSFTDARADRPGRFALADGGTVFLDEIGDVSPALQARLLRVLQDGTYEPIGATGTERTDVRVVAATNKDLTALVEAGDFRQDLFYRINVVAVELPPLRERREDIPLLVDHFIEKFNRLRGKEVTGVSPHVMVILMSHDYPGNVRELENILEHAFVMCHAATIRKRHLPSRLVPDVTAKQPIPGSIPEAEKAFLEAVLERNGWKRSATARELGIHKTTLWRKMKRLGIVPPR
jgi:PAS domain S-box-containing protein